MAFLKIPPLAHINMHGYTCGMKFLQNQREVEISDSMASGLSTLDLQVNFPTPVEIKFVKSSFHFH